MIFLKRLQRGIYGNALLPHDGVPLVLVHPYFAYERSFWGRQTSCLAEGERVAPDYLALLEGRIRNHPGPLITLEEAGRMGSTAEHYRDLGRVQHSYFIPTIRKSPRTWFGEFDELLGLLRRFSTRPVHVAGGYLDPDIRYSAGIGGCLGVTASTLQDEGIAHEIIHEITFSRSETFSSTQPSYAYATIQSQR